MSVTIKFENFPALLNFLICMIKVWNLKKIPSVYFHTYVHCKNIYVLMQNIFFAKVDVVSRVHPCPA